MSMGYRFMRLLVFFDLPTTSSQEIKRYTLFRRFLIKEGFVMMQESVYTKILLNGTMANLMFERLKKATPKQGLVQTLLITERQFANMSFISGNKKGVIEDSDKRLVKY